jgi:hypothetical protein
MLISFEIMKPEKRGCVDKIHKMVWDPFHLFGSRFCCSKLHIFTYLWYNELDQVLIKEQKSSLSSYLNRVCDNYFDWAKLTESWGNIWFSSGSCSYISIKIRLLLILLDQWSSHRPEWEFVSSLPCPFGAPQLSYGRVLRNSIFRTR